MPRAFAIVAITFASVAVALPAAAVEPEIPQGTIDVPSPDSGVVELDGQGTFGTATERTDELEDTLEWDFSLGSLISTGNARQIALNAGTNFLFRRGQHQLTIVALGNYGRAAAPEDADQPIADAPLEPNLGNVQGRVRYDYFFNDRWSFFGMVTARHDPFQELDLRLNIDPGVAWYIINTDTERLNLEAGYDFQADIPEQGAPQRNENGTFPLDDNGNVVPIPRRFVHAVRLAGGYVNTINQAVTFRTGLEYLQSVQIGLRWRVNWDIGLTTTLFRSLALATTFNVRIDNDPISDFVRSVDTVTAASLVYRFF